MKTTIFFLLFSVSSVLVSAQTNGMLTVSTTTSPTLCPGYGTNNVSAIWIENEAGNFIKSMWVSGTKRTKKLLIWYPSSVRNVVDAVTCATETTYGPRTCTWNGTDTFGIKVPDGRYRVRMELTDNNINYVTPNLFSADFVKSGEAVLLSPADVPSFAATTIKWVPVTVNSLGRNDISSLYVVLPNHTKSDVYVSGLDVLKLEVLSLNGKILLKSNQQRVDLSSLSLGSYLIHVITSKGSFVKKVVKE